MSIVRIEDVKVFEGMPLNDAISQIQGHGYEARIDWADGNTLHSEHNPSYDPLRVCLYVEKSKVIKAIIG